MKHRTPKVRLIGSSLSSKLRWIHAQIKMKMAKKGSNAQREVHIKCGTMAWFSQHSPFYRATEKKTWMILWNGIVIRFIYFIDHLTSILSWLISLDYSLRYMRHARSLKMIFVFAVAWLCVWLLNNAPENEKWNEQKKNWLFHIRCGVYRKTCLKSKYQIERIHSDLFYMGTLVCAPYTFHIFLLHVSCSFADFSCLTYNQATQLTWVRCIWAHGFGSTYLVSCPCHHRR